MPKFNKREDELQGMFEKWLFVLRNLSCLMERPAALQERVFGRLFEAAEIARFTKEQCDAYEDSLKVYRDWKNTIDTAESKGREEGLAEGLQQGLLQGRVAEKLDNARKMLAVGLDMDLVVRITGLAMEEVETLKAKKEEK